ncbi:MAG: DNA repair protein RecN [Actinomycetes bacterium]
MSAASLLELRVSDLGIIEELSVVFAPGLTVVTGETGAGKTLVMTALALLGGARADAGSVRSGATEARVEGRFLDPRTGEDTVLARVIPVDGRSRAYVDGRLATVAELAEASARLLDIHGQHAHQGLLEPAVQTALLDAFAGAPALGALAEYRAARAEVRRIDEALGTMGGDERARARELDLIAFQIEELEAAGLSDPDELDALADEEARLADADALRDALATAYSTLMGPAVDAAGTAAGALTGRVGLDGHEARLRGLQAEIQEAAHDLRDARDGVVVDPQRLAAVQERRRLLRELGRKYGATCAEMLGFLEETRNRRDELTSHEARAAALETERAQAEDAVRAAAERLGAARRSAADALAAAVAERLVRLAMPAARLQVSVEPGPDTDDGADRVAFLLAANAGEPFRPLARSASGGELARAMLAVRVALHAAGVGGEGVPVLVFDEVDAGIGGEAGTAVGRELKALAATGDVICVTHLAQVAAHADTHIVVTKRSVQDRTVAMAEVVSGDDRITELSRMLAGVGESEHARRHAAELLGATAPTGGRRARTGGGRG